MKINEADYVVAVDAANDMQKLTILQALLQERDELKAQVEQLRVALSRQLNDCINFDGSKLTDAVMAESSRTLKNTPAQCLAEVEARAGSDGFIECYFSLRKVEFGDVFDLIKSADEYAEKIRQPAKEKIMRESVKEWLADLRSGEFKQTTDVLRERNESGQCYYCCLGVAVETYKRVTGKKPLFIPSSEVGNEETLEQFPEVQTWLGLRSPSGRIEYDLAGTDEDLTSLTRLNDTGNFSFKEIADIIEEKQGQLFHG